jgi:hypothetical protein
MGKKKNNKKKTQPGKWVNEKKILTRKMKVKATVKYHPTSGKATITKRAKEVGCRPVRECLPSVSEVLD